MHCTLTITFISNNHNVEVRSSIEDLQESEYEQLIHSLLEVSNIGCQLIDLKVTRLPLSLKTLGFVPIMIVIAH